MIPKSMAEIRASERNASHRRRHSKEGKRPFSRAVDFEAEAERIAEKVDERGTPETLLHLWYSFAVAYINVLRCKAAEAPERTPIK